jgi:hypothetical protein
VIDAERGTDDAKPVETGFSLLVPHGIKMRQGQTTGANNRQTRTGGTEDLPTNTYCLHSTTYIR